MDDGANRDYETYKNNETNERHFLLNRFHSFRHSRLFLNVQSQNKERWGGGHQCEMKPSQRTRMITLIAARRTNMTPNEWMDEMNLKRHRKTIGTVNSQMEKMGLQRLHARTNASFEMKVHASLIALSLTNL